MFDDDDDEWCCRFSPWVIQTGTEKNGINLIISSSCPLTFDTISTGHITTIINKTFL